MIVATAAAKGLTGVGWISLIAVDSNVVPVGLEDSLHNDILGVLIVASIGIIAHWKRHGDSGRTYSQGVVDGMKLTAANPDVPAPRPGPDAKILYLRTGTNANPCTQHAPKTAGTRSSS